MANQFHKARHTTRHKIPVALATVIELGDLVFLDTGNNDVRPASAQVDNVGEEDNQAEYARNHLGVSAEASSADQDADLLVETGLDIDYEFDAVDAIYRFGDLLGASETSTNDGLEDQQLEAVVSEDIAIARVIDDDPVTRTKVRVRFIRSVMMSLNRRADVNSELLVGDKVLTFDDAKFQFLDPNNGGGRNVDLPPVTESAGLEFVIANTADAAEVLTIRLFGAGATIATPTQNEVAHLYSDGVIWTGGAVLEG